MDRTPPELEPAHNQPPELTEANEYLAFFLLDHINNFPREEVSDELTGIDELFDQIKTLRDVPFDEVVFDKHCRSLIDNKTASICKARLLNHENALRRGTITVFDEKDSDEISVKILPKFSDDFRKVQVQALNIEGYSDDEINTPLAKSGATIDLILTSLTDKFKLQVDKALKLLPNEDTLVEDLLFGQIIITDDFAHNFLNNHQISYAPDNREIKNVKRAIRKTINALQSYINAPESELAKIYVDSTIDQIEEIITDSAQDCIVSANTDLWLSLDAAKKIESHNPKNEEDSISKRQKRKLSSFLLKSTVEDSIDLRATEYDKLEGTVNILMQAPWIEQSERRVNELATLRGSVYIVDGINDGLSPIRDKTIGKNQEVENKIKGKIRAAAEKIADGHLPWNTKNLFTILDTDKEQEEYAEESIYCIKDKTQNATRIYFTMKHAGDLEVVTEGQGPILNPDQWCMTIIAITDKDQQVATLKQLTGRSTKYLRAYGAGSS